MPFNYNVYPLLSFSDVEKKIQGRNQSKILIVLDKQSARHRTLLVKILAAVGKQLDDVLLLELEEKEYISSDIWNRTNVSKIIIFGGHLNQICLNIDARKYQITTFKTLEVLWSDNLAVINKNVEYKRQLWKALQLFF